MSLKSWSRVVGPNVQLKIVVKPNAKKTRLIAINEQGMHIAVHAKPNKGEANEALILYLAKFFNVPKSHIVMQRGKASRYKTIILPLNENIQKLLADPASFLVTK